MSDTKSFWTTLPGILSGIAAVIGAIVSLLLVLMQLNIINPVDNGATPANDKKEISPPPAPPPDPSPGQTEELENGIHELTFKINELEEELTRIPMPAGLLHELEYQQKEFENRIVELDHMLTATREEIHELRGHDNTDPYVRDRIQKLEGETIPDLEMDRGYVENKLNQVAEEIAQAKKKKEGEDTLYELHRQKQGLQDQLNRLTMPKEVKP